MRAPLLLDGNGLPQVTADTLERLAPEGSKSDEEPSGRPDGRAARSRQVPHGHAERQGPLRAGRRDRPLLLRRQGKPSSNVIVTTGERAPGRDARRRVVGPLGRRGAVRQARRIPPATARAGAPREAEHLRSSAPDEAVSEKVERQLNRYGKVRRIPAPPVENSIEFAEAGRPATSAGARTSRASTYALASTRRPRRPRRGRRAGHGRVFAPMLVTDKAEAAAAQARGFFLDVQPRFLRATRATRVYNHVWILGDTKTLSPGGRAASTRPPRWCQSNAATSSFRAG